ncbi:MAG TPA: radical SAM protein [Candidatus Hydrogenedentes bacterium]|nr:radical SAM protein [Candidatus Hydrogenedentota bacterium]HPG70290.1 radical SAM protein [Candidatus Hydrogenedentota bacterium]
MKVLLLNPPGPFCRAGSRWPHRRNTRRVGIDYHPFPFALGYATARLTADGHQAKLVDCIALGMGDPEALEVVRDFEPDVVFMETSAPSFAADVAILRAVERPCIAGGAHATATVAEHLEAGFTAVIRGEYDQVITEAMELVPQPWLATPEAPDAEYAPLVDDLDSIPYPPWHQMPMERYNDPICRGRSVTVLSSRGCPMRCEFCTLTPYHGRRNYRLRDPVAVCDEIDALVGDFSPDEIYFDDDSITLNRDHVLTLCAEIRKRDWRLPFCCMGNATVDRDVLEAMAGAGCRAFKFGVESAVPEVLERIPKLMDMQDVLRTVRDCRALGIQTHATFLFGLPGETVERAQRTIDFALGMGAHTLQFAIVTPYPGTALYNRAKQEGWLTKEDWQSFDPAGEAVLSYPDYPAEAIVRMHDLAWRRWQRYMLTKRPATLLHHFGNAYRREGIGGIARLGAYGLSRLGAVLRTRS